MKAIVKMKLVRATRRGHTTISEKIELGRKTLMEGVEEVNNFIFTRANRTNYIPVETFMVSIQTQRGKVLKEYKYSPTYR